MDTPEMECSDANQCVTRHANQNNIDIFTMKPNREKLYNRANPMERRTWIRLLRGSRYRAHSAPILFLLRFKNVSVYDCKSDVFSNELIFHDGTHRVVLEGIGELSSTLTTHLVRTKVHMCECLIEEITSSRTNLCLTTVLTVLFLKASARC